MQMLLVGQAETKSGCLCVQILSIYCVHAAHYKSNSHASRVGASPQERAHPTTVYCLTRAVELGPRDDMHTSKSNSTQDHFCCCGATVSKTAVIARTPAVHVLDCSRSCVKRHRRTSSSSSVTPHGYAGQNVMTVSEQGLQQVWSKVDKSGVCYWSSTNKSQADINLSDFRQKSSTPIMNGSQDSHSQLL